MNTYDELKKTYDAIAQDWNKYRKQIWPDVNEFSKQIKNKTILDIGCGTGRNAQPFLQNNYVICMDFSENMLKLADVPIKLQADLLTVPIKDSSIDIVLCIAVIHHLETRKDRIKALNEIYRVLKPNGKALISVWLRKKKGDFDIPWKAHSRFYHLYSEQELKTDILETDLSLVSLYVGKLRKNIFAVVEKK